MKLFKKIAAIMLSIMMVLGMASVVSAAEGAGATTSGTSATTKGKLRLIMQYQDRHTRSIKSWNWRVLVASLHQEQIQETMLIK